MLLLLTSCVSPESEGPHPQLPHVHFQLLPALAYPTVFPEQTIWNTAGAHPLAPAFCTAFSLCSDATSHGLPTPTLGLCVLFVP